MSWLARLARLARKNDHSEIVNEAKVEDARRAAMAQQEELEHFKRRGRFVSAVGRSLSASIEENHLADMMRQSMRGH